MQIICAFQAPLWIEIGTHIGTTSRGTDPTNLPDRFYNFGHPESAAYQ